MFCTKLDISRLNIKQLPKVGDEFGTPFGMGLVHECQIKYSWHPGGTCKSESMMIWWTA
ncbi:MULTISPECIES: hypothetical protein [Pacificibacter]|uniref:hypothetical protein n=1 Tax=Pacificibacter TaxID=1042323 RepID=UPI001C0A4AD3|nr:MULTISPECIES: hypothetical protein [Pacificibacter]MBU2935446.1 hypothetical protein [Pacificibacter marinus]MDO6615600.1 hypothetical protein [Pacificibacter sp. 1_MG-2023]